MPEVAAPPIPGADEVSRWFGYWPSFHDAEILDVRLDRSGKSSIRIHTWRMTSEIDAEGYYVLDKHAVVTFWLDGVTGLSLNGFNAQNVISWLNLQATALGFRLTLAPCYGVAGEIDATNVAVSLEPGRP